MKKKDNKDRKDCHRVKKKAIVLNKTIFEICIN